MGIGNAVPRARVNERAFRGSLPGPSDFAERRRVPHRDREEVCRDRYLRHPRARWLLELVERGAVDYKGRLTEVAVDPETLRVVVPDPEDGWIPGEEDWLDAV
jgi:hypothetical protein